MALKDQLIWNSKRKLCSLRLACDGETVTHNREVCRFCDKKLKERARREAAQRTKGNKNG